MPPIDPGAIQDAGPWAIAVFILLSVVGAILHGDLVPGWIYKRNDAERVALRIELDERNAHYDKTAGAVAELAKLVKGLAKPKGKAGDGG